MKDVILDQPSQITHSIEVNRDVRVDADVDSIILAGMGGSGHPGDLLNALGLANVPLFVHRSYGLPDDYLAHMGLTKPLVVASSYSGNTEEALSAYKEAQDKGYPLMISTAGGTLEEWSQRDGTPMARIDYTGMQPRHTLFAAGVGVATVLAGSGLAEDISGDLRRVADVLAEKTPDLDEPAQQLAGKLKGTTPVFASSDELGFAAKNFKIQMNENVKNPAFWNTLPELNHNELVGFSKVGGQQGPFHAVFLRSDSDYERIAARIDVTRDLYSQWGLHTSEVYTEGETLVEKLFYAVTFGLWTTYHLANEYGIDPVPVEGVESFKAKLKDVAGQL